MSRRTPIKELIAEEASTPSSPFRRSTRIATRRPSNVDDDASTSKSKKLSASQDTEEFDRISVSSTASSMSTRSQVRTRAASKSPLSLIIDAAKLTPAKLTPARRTRRTGSASSLVDEEIAAISRSSPVPAKLTRRSLARSMSCSPISELTRTSSKKSTLSKGGIVKKGRTSSVSEPVVILESIEEMEAAPKQKENSSTDDPKDEDLPFKKKKAAYLHTITEKSFSDDAEIKTENKFDKSKNDSGEEKSSGERKITPIKSHKGTLILSNENFNKSNEEKELVVILDNEPELNKTSENSLNTSKGDQTSTLSKQQHSLKDKSNLECDSDLILHISDSDDSFSKTDKVINISGSSNNSEKENFTEDSKSRDSTKKNRLSESNDKTINNSLVKESVWQSNDKIENSFYEAMDVDITLDTEISASIKKTPSKNSHNETSSPSGKIVDRDLKLPSKGVEEQKIPKVDLVRLNFEKSPSKTITECKSPSKTIAECISVDTNCVSSNDSSNLLKTADKLMNLSSDSLSEEKNKSIDLTETTISSSVQDNTIKTSPKTSKTDTPAQLEDNLQTSLTQEDVEPSLTSPKQSREESTSQNMPPNVSNTEERHLKDSEKTHSPSPKSPKSIASPNQLNKVSSTEQNTDSIIVATNVTPLRTSPRHKKTPVSNDKAEHLKTQDTSQENIPSICSSPLASSSDTLSLKKDKPSLSPNSKSKKSDESNVVLNTSNSVIANSSIEDADCDSSKDHADDNISAIEVDNQRTSPEIQKQKNSNSKDDNQLEFSTDIEINSSLREKIIQLSKNLDNDSSASEVESLTHFIDDMAEEGEEDTPSEGSNAIIDIGESVGSSESQIDSDDSYQADSFIDDDGSVELLSGEEYDLGHASPKVKQQKKNKRIIQISDSSDEDKEIKDTSKPGTVSNDIVVAQNEDNMKNGEESDMETMSTRAYCGLTPPSIISIRESPSDGEEKTANNKEEEDSIVSALINKEDNLQSLEQIKDHRASDTFEKPVSTEKKSPEQSNSVLPSDKSTTPANDRRPASFTPNNSLLDVDSPQTEDRQRKRTSSLNIKANISLEDISDGNVTNRIMKVVEAFCANVNKSNASEGNISLNLSLDLNAPQSDNIDEKSISEISVDNSNRRRSVSESNSSRARRRFSMDCTQEKKIQNSTPTRKQNDIQVVASASSPQKDSPKKRKIEGELTNDKPLKNKRLRKSPVEERTAKNERKEKKRSKRENTKPQILITKSSPSAREETVLLSDSEMSDDLDKELTGKYSNSTSDENAEDEQHMIRPEPPKLNLRNLRAKKGGILEPQLKNAENKNIKESKLVLQKEQTKPKGIKKSNQSAIKTQKHTKQKPKSKINSPEVAQNTNWEIQYLPVNIKNALDQTESTKYIKKTPIKKVEKISTKPLRKPKLLPSTKNTRKSWISDELQNEMKPSTSCEINEAKKIKTQEFHIKDYKSRMTFDSNRVKRMAVKELLKKKEKMKF